MKAEDRAYECFPNEDIESKKARFGFLLGYHQAEKDLELGWEDISIIRQIMFDYNRQVRNEMSIPSNEDYCKEILKRFKDLKERKEK